MVQLDMGRQCLLTSLILAGEGGRVGRGGQAGQQGEDRADGEVQTLHPLTLH